MFFISINMLLAEYFTTPLSRIVTFKLVGFQAQIGLFNMVHKFSTGVRAMLWKGYSSSLTLACFILFKTILDVFGISVPMEHLCHTVKLCVI